MPMIPRSCWQRNKMWLSYCPNIYLRLLVGLTSGLIFTSLSALKLPSRTFSLSAGFFLSLRLDTRLRILFLYRFSVLLYSLNTSSSMEAAIMAGVPLPSGKSAQHNNVDIRIVLSSHCSVKSHYCIIGKSTSKCEIKHLSHAYQADIVSCCIFVLINLFTICSCCQ